MKFLHTMIRVKDIEKSLKFYTEVFRFLRSGLFAGSSVLQQQLEKEEQQHGQG